MVNKNRGRSRRRRQNRVIVLGGAAILLAAAVTAVGLVLRHGTFRQESLAVEEPDRMVLKAHEESALTVLETVTVEGIDITGLDRKEAEERLSGQLMGAVVAFEDETVAAEEAMGPAISSLLDEFYEGGKAAPGAYELSDGSLEESFRILASRLAGKWNRAAVDSEMVSFDRETGIYTYSEAVAGRILDEEKLARELVQAVKGGKTGTQVVPEFKETAPKRTAAQAKEQYQVIGSFTTQTTNNKNRNQNIRLAVESIDGRILKPGEEFSFNLSTGNRTKEKGYQPAGAYRNGVLIEEPGGGVCQVSTTLYNAIVNSGLKATERHSHSFKPSYIQPGQDAMVSFDGYAGPDLKFVNTEQTSVAVRASFKDNTLKISIVGLPVLEDGVKITMRSEQVKEVQPPEPVYEENGQLPPGTEKVVDSGQKGGIWKTYRVITRDGKVLEETPLHNTTYRGKPPVIQKNEASGEMEPGMNTDGAQPAAGESQSAAGGAQSAGGESQAAAGESQSTGDESRPAAGGTQVTEGEPHADTGNHQEGTAGQTAETGGRQNGAPGQSEENGVIISAFPGAKE